MLEFYSGFLTGALCFSIFIVVVMLYSFYRLEKWSNEVNSENWKG